MCVISPFLLIVFLLLRQPSACHADAVLFVAMLLPGLAYRSHAFAMPVLSLLLLLIANKPVLSFCVSLCSLSNQFFCESGQYHAFASHSQSVPWQISAWAAFALPSPYFTALLHVVSQQIHCSASHQAKSPLLLIRSMYCRSIARLCCSHHRHRCSPFCLSLPLHSGSMHSRLLRCISAPC